MSDHSSASTKRTIRACSSCNSRMSSIDLDPHVVCVGCRGKESNHYARCNVCFSWSFAEMDKYIKHRSLLERKRRSKQKARSGNREPDFAISCTVGAGAGPSDNVDHPREGSIEGSVSSAVESASHELVQNVLRHRF